MPGIASLVRHAAPCCAFMLSSLSLLAAGVAGESAPSAQTPANQTPATQSPATLAIDTLAVVNDDVITSAALDSLVMTTHRSGDAQRMVGMDARRLLDKAINDRLLIQQAEGLALDEEPPLRDELRKALARDAVRAYIADSFVPPDSVSDAAVQEFFTEYYWRIELRQLSVRTMAEVRELRQAVLAGADMDSLARARSVDTRRYRGGLHNFKHWADVEQVLRDAVQGLADGELSQPFPVREAFSFVRVERRSPADPAELLELRAKIVGMLLAQEREAAWTEFVAERRAQSPVTVEKFVLAEVRSEASDVLRGEFLRGSERAVLTLAGEPPVTETQLRKVISRTAMTNGTAPFDTILAQALDEVTVQLVLSSAARAGGYYERPAVLSAHEKRREQGLIEAYLNEFIVPEITFRRDEFEAYHAEHADDFRGPDQVRIATLVLPDERIAREVEARLAEGADIRFLAAQYEDQGASFADAAGWSSIDIFSDAIRGQLLELKTGETGRPVPVAHGWLVVKVEERVPGPVLALADVEMQIRQIMFQSKFNELLDEHLELLKERSEIVLHEDRIERYFAGS